MTDEPQQSKKQPEPIPIEDEERPVSAPRLAEGLPSIIQHIDTEESATESLDEEGDPIGMPQQEANEACSSKAKYMRFFYHPNTTVDDVVWYNWATSSQERRPQSDDTKRKPFRCGNVAANGRRQRIIHKTKPAPVKEHLGPRELEEKFLDDVVQRAGCDFIEGQFEEKAFELFAESAGFAPHLPVSWLLENLDYILSWQQMCTLTQMRRFLSALRSSSYLQQCLLSYRPLNRSGLCFLEFFAFQNFVFGNLCNG